MDMRELMQMIKEKYIHVVIMIILLTLFEIVFNYKSGLLQSEDAKVGLQALTGIATLALLYFVYFYVASKKEEDIARLELPGRPVLVWDLESPDSGARLILKSMQHPIYNLVATLKLNGKEFRMEDKHIDIYDEHANVERKIDISDFLSEAFGQEKAGVIELSFTYHSEIGGRYKFVFTREAVKKPYGYVFKDPKIISAHYPWKKEPTYFND
jgi:hypothetical protein